MKWHVIVMILIKNTHFHRMVWHFNYRKPDVMNILTISFISLPFVCFTHMENALKRTNKKLCQFPSNEQRIKNYCLSSAEGKVSSQGGGRIRQVDVHNTQDWVHFLAHGDIVVQPCFDLGLVTPDPFDVVPHRLQRLLPGHLSSSSIWSQFEEMLHLKDQRKGIQ